MISSIRKTNKILFGFCKCERRHHLTMIGVVDQRLSPYHHLCYGTLENTMKDMTVLPGKKLVAHEAL